MKRNGGTKSSRLHEFFLKIFLLHSVQVCPCSLLSHRPHLPRALELSEGYARFEIERFWGADTAVVVGSVLDPNGRGILSKLVYLDPQRPFTPHSESCGDSIVIPFFEKRSIFETTFHKEVQGPAFVVS